MRTFLKYFFTAYVLAVALVVGIAGFRGSKSTKPPLEVFPDMDRQARYKPQTFVRNVLEPIPFDDAGFDTVAMADIETFEVTAEAEAEWVRFHEDASRELLQTWAE